MMINDEIKPILSEFFDSTNKLKDFEIIRSSKYTADIAEFLVKNIYNITLCGNQRQEHYDAFDETTNKTYQIKINNSSEKTNQDVGKPEFYDYLILLITEKSRLFDPKFEGQFITVYKMSSKSLKGGKYIAKNEIHSTKPEYLIDRNFNIYSNGD